MTGAVIQLTPIVSLALEVIAGLWGNGEERKQLLQGAGYDYNLIQACVNELMDVINKYGGS